VDQDFRLGALSWSIPLKKRGGSGSGQVGPQGFYQLFFSILGMKIEKKKIKFHR
jgi:hypothetical protein